MVPGGVLITRSSQLPSRPTATQPGEFFKMAESGATREYLETLLQAYEEEVSGEAYFFGLAEHFTEVEKTILLARAEQVAAESVTPLLAKYGLRSRDTAALHRAGRENVQRHQAWSWIEFMTHIHRHYPGYLDEFEALKDMAPTEDHPALDRLTEHEIAVIEFARRELAGDPDSTGPVLDYLDRHAES